MRQRKPDWFKLFLQLISATLLLLLCSCISSGYWTWQHPDKQGERQRLKDQKECHELARTEVAQINYYYAFYNMGQRYEYLSYSPYYYDRYRRPYFHSYHHFRFIQQQGDLERFFQICMKAKGWRRIHVEPEKK